MSINYALLPLHKGTPRQTLARRQQREEQKVKKAVRKACVERDGYCRIGCVDALYVGCRDKEDNDTFRSICAGPSEWAHMHQKRRSQTRNQAPEVRHTTADSFMLCRLHHDRYDGRAAPPLVITRLTRQGANGSLNFRRGKTS